ncbi:recombinase family protein [Paracoccus sp. KR1-242]|uniref:recombinase family protein n=1 Tax=Paracoccus sp. KR1-242 TaxID=3410028 RepID=UPI003C102DD1
MNDLTDHPKTAIGYIRVSTEMQAQDDRALERQADLIRKFAAARRIRLDAIYEDVGSGADAYTLSRRPGLQDASRRVVSEEVACLIVPEPSRLFRNVAAAEQWLQTYNVPVLSVRDGGVLTDQQFLDAVRQGEEVAQRIREGTSAALETHRATGRVVGPSGGKRAANKASVKARAARSDGIVDMIAHILLEDPAYRDLSHRALADLLNRRNVLSGWERPWTPAGVRRARYEAEKRIAERQALDLEDDSTPVDEEAVMQALPTFGMFGNGN